MENEFDKTEWFIKSFGVESLKSNYELGLKVQEFILDTVEDGIFPVNQLLMTYRLFANIIDVDKMFIFTAKQEYDKGDPLTSANAEESPFYMYFKSPKHIYFVQEVINKALVKEKV